jgi:hypothetical protein
MPSLENNWFKARRPFRLLILKIGVELSSLSQKNPKTAVQKKIQTDLAGQIRNQKDLILGFYGLQ